MTPTTTAGSPAATVASAFTRPGLKFVVVRPRLLFPADCGAQTHSAQMLKQLNREHSVTLVAGRLRSDTDEDVEATAAFCENLITVPVNRGSSEGDAARALARTVAGVYKTLKPDALICDSIYACEALRQAPNAPFILFQHHPEAAVLHQRAARAHSLLDKMKLNWRAWRMRSFEEKECRRALCVIAVSDADRFHFQNDFGAEHCEVARAGVDTAYFSPVRTPVRTNNIVFTGSLDWPANQDAVEHFVEHIFPLIQKESPNVMFSIVGRNATARILKLGERPGINVTDAVNDVRPYVYNAKVYVAPQRMSGGTRLSVLQALAMGKAIVTTSAGSEGLMAEHGRNILIADAPADFARETVSLLRDDSRRRMLEQNARSLAERAHTWAHSARDFSDICTRAVAHAIS